MREETDGCKGRVEEHTGTHEEGTVGLWQTGESTGPLQTGATTRLYPTAVMGNTDLVLTGFRIFQEIWILMRQFLIFKHEQTNSNFKEQYAEQTQYVCRWGIISGLKLG